MTAVRKAAYLLLCLIAAVQLACVQGNEDTVTPTASTLNVVHLFDSTLNGSETRGTGQLSGTAALASWTECPDEDFQLYRLYRSQSQESANDSSQAELVFSAMEPESTEFIDSTLAWNSDYYYALQTTNGRGYSSWSNVAHVGTYGDPEDNWILELVSASPEEFDLFWPEFSFGVFESYDLLKDHQPNIQNYPSSAQLIYTSDDPAASQYQDTDTYFGRNIYYALRIDRAGIPPLWSNELQVYFEPVPLTLKDTQGGFSQPAQALFVNSGMVCVSENVQGGSIVLVSVPDMTVQAELASNGTPVCIDRSMNGSFIYAATSNPDRLLKLDPENLQIIASMDLDGDPGGLLAEANGDEVYCTLNQPARLAVIDPAEMSVIGEVALDAYPTAICSDLYNEYLCIACTGNSRLNVVSTSTWTVEHIISVDPFPLDVALSIDGSWVYASCWGNSTVHRINTGSWQNVLQISVAEGPAGLAVHPEGWLYVACESADSVYVTDSALTRAYGSAFADDGCRDVCVSPDGNSVLTVNRHAGSLSLLQFK